MNFQVSGVKYPESVIWGDCIKKDNIAEKIGKLALKKKASDIIIVDLKSITPMFDDFVIFSGASKRQVKVLADFTVEELKKENIRPVSLEGKAESGWILIDYGRTLAHVFHEETRNFYQIERLFKDAKITQVE